MNDSVLNLGERIVLAARLAAAEHIRRELAEASAEPDAAAEDNQVLGKLPTIDGIVRATNVASAPRARETGLNGWSTEPAGVDLVTLPGSEVGEY